MGAAAHEVDDLAQDVYLELYRHFDKMPADVSPERWIKGIARNVCQNHFRRSARRGRLHREMLAEILARVESPTERLMNECSVNSALEDCVAKLPADHRRLIELRYQQDLTSSAIAARLSSTAEAVRVTLYRIRASLKNCVSLKLAGEA